MSVDACVLAFLLLEQNECLVLNGLVQVVHLDVRVVHVGIEPDHTVMASLHVVQRIVPAAPGRFGCVWPAEQPFEGTHLAG